MGIHKLFIRLFVFILIVSTVNCKSKTSTKNNEQQATILNHVVPKDSTPTYPKYLTKSYVLGQFDYTKHQDFVKIPKEFSSETRYLRREVFDMFHKMATKAQKEGIILKIVSATRNFSHQKRIWDYKWNDKYKSFPRNERALKILEYSSMPGTSRHHWGTDLDINDLEDEYFLKGKGKKEYAWLCKNANSFGFYQVYTSKKQGRTGYNEEKWHWSYVPLSSIYLKFYNQNVTHQDIKGFQGSHFAKDIDMITNYVNGINTKILAYKP
ncbi:M15 family metallopeptidase [Tenacibaculum agarivorans]|uniref:M15 family metallopeptidase n=1 Tax=Tenacibaculum agarivorans TaxID=1908389 RepID=UPI000B325E26|nr:M15 family metallopeptidase [Tenacibaculum agarivorans]